MLSLVDRLFNAESKIVEIMLSLQTEVLQLFLNMLLNLRLPWRWGSMTLLYSVRHSIDQYTVPCRTAYVIQESNGLTM